jgi:hypothetical protein
MSRLWLRPGSVLVERPVGDEQGDIDNPDAIAFVAVRVNKLAASAVALSEGTTLSLFNLASRLVGAMGPLIRLWRKAQRVVRTHSPDRRTDQTPSANPYNKFVECAEGSWGIKAKLRPSRRASSRTMPAASKERAGALARCAFCSRTGFRNRRLSTLV